VWNEKEKKEKMGNIKLPGAQRKESNEKYH
jgi:hypothetical protein